MAVLRAAVKTLLCFRLKSHSHKVPVKYLSRRDGHVTPLVARASMVHRTHQEASRSTKHMMHQVDL